MTTEEWNEVLGVANQLQKMKASELRIGNKLTKDTGVIFTVYEVKQNSVKATYQVEDRDFPPPTPRDRLAKGERMAIIDLDKLSPIPLTPEILEKAGFVTIGRYAIGVGGYNVFAKGRIELLQPNEGDPYILAFYEAKITHLHQLQNLYFALTGQELTINL